MKPGELVLSERAKSSLCRASASLSFSLSLIDGVSLALMLTLPVLAFGYSRMIMMSWPSVATFDLLVFACNPSIGLPLIWFMCPLVTMVMLARIWRERERAAAVMCMGKRKTVWAACVGDILVVSIICAAVVHVSLLTIGIVSTGAWYADADSQSPLFFYTGGSSLSDLDVSGAFVVMLGYEITSLAASNLLFFLLYLCLGARPAYFAVAVLAFPEVHKTHSIVHDIVSGYGGDLMAVNPLSYFYETSSVFYPSWLVGASHEMWFLVVIVIALLLFTRFAMRKREYLG